MRAGFFHRCSYLSLRRETSAEASCNFTIVFCFLDWRLPGKGQRQVPTTSRAISSAERNFYSELRLENENSFQPVLQCIRANKKQAFSLMPGLARLEAFLKYQKVQVGG